LGFELDDTSKISVGAQYVDRTKSNTVFDNSDSGRFCGDSSIFVPSANSAASFCDRSLSFSTFLDAGSLSNLLIPFNGDSEGFLDSTSANIPRNFLIPNIDVIEQAFVNFGQAAGQRIIPVLDANGEPVLDANGDAVTTLGPISTVAQLSGSASFLDPVLNGTLSNEIEESTIAGMLA